MSVACLGHLSLCFSEDSFFLWSVIVLFFGWCNRFTLCSSVMFINLLFRFGTVIILFKSPCLEQGMNIWRNVGSMTFRGWHMQIWSKVQLGLSFALSIHLYIIQHAQIQNFVMPGDRDRPLLPNHIHISGECIVCLLRSNKKIKRSFCRKRGVLYLLQ
jgi:hypothetical protein